LCVMNSDEWSFDAERRMLALCGLDEDFANWRDTARIDGKEIHLLLTPDGGSIVTALKTVRGIQ
jgi:hypothetical protein